MFTPLHTRLGFDGDATAGIDDPEATGDETTLPALETLASRRLFQDRGLGGRVGLVSALAHRSLSVAFSTWAHLMVIEYLSATRGDQGLIAALEDGDMIGSTAMASALRASLGLDKVTLRAVDADPGYRISGSVPWASNLYPTRTVVVAAAERSDGSHLVVAMPVGTETVYPAPRPTLIALQATASGRLIVENAPVQPDQILSEDLNGFLEAVRPTFMLVQAAFAVGLGEVSLAGLADPLEGSDRVLVEDREKLVEQHDQLVGHTIGAVNGGNIEPRAAIAFRLEASEFAQAAVAAEAKRVGGRGYVATSDTARRVREAAFLPIQSPTETQLRWELSCSA